MCLYQGINPHMRDVAAEGVMAAPEVATYKRAYAPVPCGPTPLLQALATARGSRAMPRALNGTFEHASGEADAPGRELRDVPHQRALRSQRGKRRLAALHSEPSGGRETQGAAAPGHGPADSLAGEAPAR